VVDGVWQQVLENLHEIFQHDFVAAQLTCGELPVKWDTNILSRDNFCEGFWHLISQTDGTGGRIFDPRRAERLAWVAALIMHSTDPSVKCWEYLEASGRVRIYIWLEDLDYVVILEKQNTVARLVTAFYVDGNSKRRGLTRKYENRLKANAAHLRGRT
jgi:hypothetical protein